MKRLLLLLLPLGGLQGCSPWTQSQIDLVTQARRGVAMVAADDLQRDQSMAELAKLRRQRLDEAFDADLRQRETLDADWVIDARRAYAVALDAYAQAEAAAQQSAQQRKRNLAAIDAALVRLQWLQSIQFKLLSSEGQ